MNDLFFFEPIFFTYTNLSNLSETRMRVSDKNGKARAPVLKRYIQNK